MSGVWVVVSIFWAVWLVGIALILCNTYEVPVLTKVWDGMKRALRDIFYRLAHPGYSLARPAVVKVPEPDWAAAADEVGFFDPLDHILLNVSAWTPEEREAYGVNATDILIDAIDKELKATEWQRMVANYPRAPLSVGRERETASEKAIRRNGAQITASVVDQTKTWVGPAMNSGM